ncbi:hypothetical protein ABZ599_16125 [Streptomyces misionensis]|uniref:hypothetical protein n=1 Tax=Streptomyces misionensis TaxID=67331 RepID=UPI0033D309B9
MDLRRLGREHSGPCRSGGYLVVRAAGLLVGLAAGLLMAAMRWVIAPMRADG